MPKSILQLIKSQSDLHRESADTHGVGENLISQKIVDAVYNELNLVIDACTPSFKKDFDDWFYGTKTKRLQGLIMKSPSFVDGGQLLLESHYHQFCSDSGPIIYARINILV